MPIFANNLLSSFFCIYGWKNTGEKQDLNSKDGRYQKCGDIQTDDGKGKILGKMDR